MKQHIGTKIVNATPMNRLDYNVFRGWDLPKDEDGTDEGYLVEYTDGGAPNTSHYKGYVSWSPKEQFDNAYEDTSEAMTFGHALEAMKLGLKVARAGWNGKNMFVVYMPALYLPCYNHQEPGPKVNDRTAKHIGKELPLDSQPYLAMFNAQQQWQPGWIATQSDLLSEDWVIVK